MDDTATSAGNSSVAASTSSTLDAASLLTTAHLVWLAVFAVLVVAAIVYGMRRHRVDKRAERQVVEHAREAGVAPPSPRAANAHVAPAQATEQINAPVPASPAAPPATDADADGSVSQLKGLGPKVATRLSELGITTVGQIAALDDDGARALDDQLGPFKGRLERDRWIEQARFLAAGDRKGFEAVFGKL